MEAKIKEYPSQEITVLWNSSICVHCGKCAMGLPEVFKPKERPWIQVDGAPDAQIVEQVKKCPSGAISIK